ncbi:MAG: GAF domain-containing sensor histidine kinase [Microcoleus sp. CSU_2_2]|nr:GAF domain-containing sensor histidine kinase [Microcoleus sp. SU_5_3]NJS10432.1 GAF domain-containing sensor histidine kinase [Microcoleus sp. CSU_2_2]
MLMPASSEFVKLCRSQVAIAVSLGATFSAVYLTEELVEGSEAKLVPIAVYPETSVEWEEHQGLRLQSPESSAVKTVPRRLASQTANREKPTVEAIAPESLPGFESNSQQCQGPENVWQQRMQMVTPMIHEGAVMGLLVSGRQDRSWSDREEAQMKQIARTLALACILDQRSQWMHQELGQQQQLQTQVYDTMHNLLHQFKSPLTALRTFGKLLVRRLVPEDRNRDVASSIVRESDRLQELLLQFDRTVDTGEANLRLPSNTSEIAVSNVESIRHSPLSLSPATNIEQSCSVAEVLTPLLISAEAIASERNLKLLADIPADLPLVSANDRDLREVLSNLIDNALKYTPADCQIYIKVEYGAADADRIAYGQVPAIAVAVSDTGTGIPPQDLEHLFERHYRGEKAQTEIPGTGLGLAIARDLVRQMQGKIEVFSPINPEWLPSMQPHLYPTDRGTTFVVWLPLNQ